MNPVGSFNLKVQLQQFTEMALDRRFFLQKQLPNTQVWAPDQERERAWHASVQKQKSQLKGLEEKLEATEKEIARLTNVDETKQLELAHMRREVAMVRLALIDLLIVRFEGKKTLTGRVMALQNRAISEDGAAFAAEQVYSAILSEHGKEAKVVESAKDARLLHAEVAGLRQVVEQGSLYGRINLTEKTKASLSEKLTELEKHEQNVQKQIFQTELIAQNVHDQFEDYDLDETLSRAKQLFLSTNFVPPSTAAGKVTESVKSIWGFFVGTSSEEPAFAERLDELYANIQRLDQFVHQKRAALVKSADRNQEKIVRLSHKLAHITRLVVQEKLRLADQLLQWTESIAQDDSLSSEQRKEAEELHGHIALLLRQQVRTDASQHARELAYGELLSLMESRRFLALDQAWVEKNDDAKLWEFDPALVVYRDESLLIEEIDKILEKQMISGIQLERPVLASLQTTLSTLLSKQRALLIERRDSIAEEKREVTYQKSELMIQQDTDDRQITRLERDKKPVDISLLRQSNNRKRQIEALKIQEKEFDHQIRTLTNGLADIDAKIAELNEQLTKWEWDKPFYQIDQEIKNAPDNKKEQLEVARTKIIQDEIDRAQELLHNRGYSENTINALEDRGLDVREMATVSKEVLEQERAKIAYYEGLLDITGGQVHRAIAQAAEDHLKYIVFMESAASQQTANGYRDALQFAVEWTDHLQEVITQTEQWNESRGQPISERQQEKLNEFKQYVKEINQRIAQYRKSYHELYKAEFKEKIHEGTTLFGVLEGIGQSWRNLVFGSDPGYIYEWTTTDWGRKLRTAAPDDAKALYYAEEEIVRTEILLENLDLQIQEVRNLKTQFSDAKSDLQVADLNAKLIDLLQAKESLLGDLRFHAQAKEGLIRKHGGNDLSMLEIQLLDKPNEDIPEQVGEVVKDIEVLKHELEMWDLERPLVDLDRAIEASQDGSAEKARLELERDSTLRALIKEKKDERKVTKNPDSLNSLDRAIAFYTEKKRDPGHIQQMLSARTIILESEIQSIAGKIPQQNEKLTLGQVTEALGNVGAGIVKVRNELMRLSVEVELLSESVQTKPQLENKLKEIEQHFKGLNTRQKELQDEHKRLYREARKEEMEQEEDQAFFDRAQKLVSNFISGFAQALEEKKPLYIHDWQTDSESASALNYSEIQSMDAELRLEIFEAKLKSKRADLASCNDSKIRTALTEEEKKLTNTQKSALAQSKELSAQKNAAVLTQIIDHTNLKRCQQNDLQARITDIEKLINELNSGQRGSVESLKTDIAREEKRVGKLKKELQIIGKSLEGLRAAFDEAMAEYQRYPEPRRNFLESLTKHTFDSLKEVASLGYLKTAYVKPQEFQTRWEIANLGYDWKAAIADFADMEGDENTALPQLVNEFLNFAKSHPSVAESLFTDMALTISLLGNEELLTTLTKGFSAHLQARALLRGVSSQVMPEPALTRADLKWVALADIAKHGQQFAAAVNVGQAAWEGAKSGGVAGALINAIEKAVVQVPKNALIQKVIKETSPDYLNLVDTGIRLARGDSIPDILANKQRLALLQGVGTVADAIFHPEGFWAGLKHYVGHQVNLFKEAGMGEKLVRLTALVGVPVISAGAAIAAVLTGLALTTVFFIVFAGFFIATPAAYSLVNTLFADTEFAVKENEVRSWLANNPEGRNSIINRRDDLIKDLQARKLLSKEKPQPVDPSRAELEKEQRDKIEVALNESYEEMQQLRGELHIAEVIDIFFKKTDILGGDPSTPQTIYLQDLVRYEFKDWLEDKLLHACEYEFVITVSHYDSPEKYKAEVAKRQAEREIIPITPEDVMAREIKLRQGVEEKVGERLPELKKQDAATFNAFVNALYKGPDLSAGA